MTQTTHSIRWRAIGLSAAGLALISTLCPWISTPLFSRSGISTGDGKILAVLAIAAIVTGALATKRRLGIGYLVCGGIGALIAWYDMVQVAKRIGALPSSPFAANVSTGVGLYLAVIATATLVICGIALTARKQ